MSSFHSNNDMAMSPQDAAQLSSFLSAIFPTTFGSRRDASPEIFMLQAQVARLSERVGKLAESLEAIFGFLEAMQEKSVGRSFQRGSEDTTRGWRGR